MKITYLGQCGFLLETGDARIVTDPYLSDYVDKTAEDGMLWTRKYPAPAALADLRPDAVLISHSHGDHLDPWTLGGYIENGGDALLCAPAPECGLLEKLGARNIWRAVAEEDFWVKNVHVTPIPCAHTQLHMDENGRYRELSYIIESGEDRLFFGGDMSLYPGLIERLEQAACPILLLPVNGRDDARTAQGIIGNIDCVEAANLAAKLGARCFVPMHHDLYAGNGCSTEAILAAAAEARVAVQLLRPGETWTVER